MPDIKLNPINKKPIITLDLPGSKSIANRVLPLAAMSFGTSIIHNIPSDSEDVSLMLAALDTLGILVEDISANSSTTHKSYKIHGCNGILPNKNAQIFCGNSGTTIRFLSAILAFMDGEYILDGIDRMHERPIKDLVLTLESIGANISYLKNTGYPPLKILPFSDNNKDSISISGKVSSQYLTGVLLAVSLLKREVTIAVYDELISKPYVDITIGLLAKFGVKTLETNQNRSYTINTASINNSLTGTEYTVEPDASSASYFLALGAISGDVTINNLSETSLQGDRNFAKVLKLMGANVEYCEHSIRVTPGASIQKHNKLTAININMEDMPDVAMTIAVLALFANGTTIISGIHSWKVKETDRLLAIHNELKKLGANVIITDSSITITPPQSINSNVEIDTYNDHRMAMCFSLVAAYGIPITIKDYECVNKTFPSYFTVFSDICYN